MRSIAANEPNGRTPASPSLSARWLRWRRSSWPLSVGETPITCRLAWPGYRSPSMIGERRARGYLTHPALASKAHSPPPPKSNPKITRTIGLLQAGSVFRTATIPRAGAGVLLDFGALDKAVTSICPVSSSRSALRSSARARRRSMARLRSSTPILPAPRSLKHLHPRPQRPEPFHHLVLQNGLHIDDEIELVV